MKKDKPPKKAIIAYLEKALALRPTFSDKAYSESIPYIIKNNYILSNLKLLDHSFLLLWERENVETSPATIAKHIRWLEDRIGLPAIFGFKSIEAYNRKRLVERKIPFIVPGSQLYLPDLGIDFQEHLKKARSKKDTLSPSAQLVLLAYLLRKPEIDNWTATNLAGVFNTSKMTMSRAIDSLIDVELIDVVQDWREKQIYFKEDRKTLWKRALPYLKSPVQKRVFVENIDVDIGTVAGLCALAELTMIASPARKVRALSRKEWKSLQKDKNLRIIPDVSKELAAFEFEIWRYDPKVLSIDGIADPLSLYLSSPDEGENDERVQGELKHLLTVFKW